MAVPVCPQPQFNTYIGARYVPVFAGTWDNTQTYEPLMIVQYQGNSYTSKTYVPAGIDITNDTYWAITGNYNAQIEEYRREVQGVVGQLDAIETDVNQLNTTVDGIINRSPLAPQSNIVTVGKKGAMFTTINDAINYAKTYCSYSNRVTIKIGPGTYNEMIKLLPNPGIDFVGAGANITQVHDNSVYPDAPLFVSGNTNVQDITFVCNRPSGSSAADYNSYAMHLEALNNPTGGSIYIKNCNFLSYNNSGVGIGTGQSWSVQLINCEIASMNGPGLRCHNYPDTATSQTLMFVSCRINSFNGQRAIWCHDACKRAGHTGSPMSLSFHDCYSSNPVLEYGIDNENWLGYIPTNGENIKLTAESTTNILGADYTRNTFQAGGFINCSGSGYMTITLPDANRYDYQIQQFINAAGDNINDTVSFVSSSNPNYAVFRTSDSKNWSQVINANVVATAKK